MNHIETLGAIKYKKDKKLYYYLLFLFSICLNQSSIIGGFNFSLSDLIVIGIVICLLYKGIRVPKYQLLYFLFLSAVLLATASFYTPSYFHITAKMGSILKDYIKVLVAFVYFLVGYNLIQGKWIHLALRWYSCFALFIGTVGIFTSLLGITFLRDILYFGEVRYRGLMNDPNFFAIVQISSLPFFMKSARLSLNYKISIYLIILASTILSGSKTGMITLLIYTLLFIFSQLLKNELKMKNIFLVIFFGVSICLLYLFIGEFQVLDKIGTLGKSMQLRRISLLFTDFNSAINDGGSSRLPVWKTGIDIIELSPLIGVGVGMYSDVAQRVSGIGDVAHNTYIQFFSEWGGIFASIFFLYLVLLILKVTFNKNLNNRTNLILRDILIIILIGSLAISFNNARMFWFFIGALVCGVNEKQQVINAEISSQNKEQEKIRENNQYLLGGYR